MAAGRGARSRKDRARVAPAALCARQTAPPTPAAPRLRGGMQPLAAPVATRGRARPGRRYWSTYCVK